MDTKNLEAKIDGLKNSIDLLILIELCKCGVKRDEAREAIGALSNSTYAKINKIISNRK